LRTHPMASYCLVIPSSWDRLSSAAYLGGSICISSSKRSDE
jgi:hypothetical protein